jgi:hypothetical protein
VTDLRVAVPGSYRIFDENGTVVAGHWANADGVNALLAASFGAAAAWGIVVGTLNVLMTMFKRTKRNKLLNQIRTAPDPQHAVAILEHQFETEVLDVVPPAERPTFYGTIVEHVSQSAAARHPISTQAIVGGVIIFVLRIVSTLPRRSRSCSWKTRRPQSSGRASSRSRCCSRHRENQSRRYHGRGQESSGSSHGGAAFRRLSRPDQLRCCPPGRNVRPRR